MKLHLSETYSYDQRASIKDWVLNFIHDHSIESILDIGAGSGELAKAYSDAVNAYLAVERDHERVQQLEASEINVIEGQFPCKIIGQYGLVLISHSLPEQIDQYGSFLRSAWELVCPGGLLCIVTFKGNNDETIKIRSELTGHGSAHDADLYQETMKILQQFGTIHTEIIVSKETTQKADDLIQTISLGLGWEYPYQSNRLESIVGRYRVQDRYVFHHEHLVLWIKKL